MEEEDEEEEISRGKLANRLGHRFSQKDLKYLEPRRSDRVPRRISSDVKFFSFVE